MSGQSLPPAIRSLLPELASREGWPYWLSWILTGINMNENTAIGMEYDRPPGRREDDPAYRLHPDARETLPTRYVTPHTVHHALAPEATGRGFRTGSGARD